MPDDTRHQVNLLDFFAFLLRWRRFIIASVLSVSIAVVVIVLLLPSRYRSTAIVRAQESGGHSIGSLIASKLGSLGGLANLAPSLGEVPEEMYLTILKSRLMSDRVIEHFDLRSVYKIQDTHPEEVVKVLLARTNFELDELSSDITIEVEDRDPKRAREMTEFYVDQLDRRNQELKSLAAHKEREFIGQRLDEERSRLAMLEDSMYRFQVATGVLNVEEQVKATIQAAAVLEAQKIAAETEHEMNFQILGPANPETQFSLLKVASIDSSLQSLMHSNDARTNAFLLGIAEVPSAGLTYLRIMRDIEIQQLLVGYLLQQHEQARIAELRNTPTLMRIDPPVEATRRIWPRRGLMVGIAFFATFIFSSAIALLFEMVTKASLDISHPQHQHLANLRRSWKAKS